MPKSFGAAILRIPFGVAVTLDTSSKAFLASRRITTARACNNRPASIGSKRRVVRVLRQHGIPVERLVGEKLSFFLPTVEVVKGLEDRDIGFETNFLQLQVDAGVMILAEVGENTDMPGKRSANAFSTPA